MKLLCETCKKQFHRPPSKLKSYEGRQKNKHNFCSRKCYEVYWKKNVGMKGRNHWKWQGGNVKGKCEQCKRFFSKRRKGKNRKYKFCSKLCLYKWLKGRFIKDKNPNWKDSPPNKGRTESKYLEWRLKVYKKDDYKCKIEQVYNHKCEGGKELRAHHIKGYKLFPELRYEVSNGITLHQKCHLLVHKKKLDPVETTRQPLFPRG